MFTLILMEHENSLPDVRNDLTMTQAYAIASKGGYYKAQQKIKQASLHKINQNNSRKKILHKVCFCIIVIYRHTIAHNQGINHGDQTSL